MGFIQEFKSFAIKGNLVDMAIGVVMGAAFGKVVSAFIDGMFMPLVGLITSGQDFSKLVFELKPEVKDAAGVVTQAAVAIKYGTFVTVAIEFTLVAFVMFMLIKGMNSLKKQEAAAPAPPVAPPAPTKEEILLAEIRDLLKNK
jgi:large conductance mechanosensitive channel